METNWIIISVVVIITIFLIFFLIRRNAKDEKEYENYLENNDLPIDKEDDEVNNDQ
jgi:preprotein translocase subunit YajC